MRDIKQFKIQLRQGSLLLLFLGLPTIFFGQSCSIINNMYSFFTERSPGTLRVDRNGKPFPIIIDTTFIVYAETNTNEIIWQNAFHNGKEYVIANHEIVATPFNVGHLINSTIPIILQIKNGNFLWQLYLAPILISRKPPTIINHTQLLINGKFKGKSFLKISDAPRKLGVAPAV